jgi:hypothetical protein
MRPHRPPQQAGLGQMAWSILRLRHASHLSFNVESPTSTSIIVMIQKRTTT